jgi:hypothetical protein
MIPRQLPLQCFQTSRHNFRCPLRTRIDRTYVPSYPKKGEMDDTYYFGASDGDFWVYLQVGFRVLAVWDV